MAPGGGESFEVSVGDGGHVTAIAYAASRATTDTASGAARSALPSLVLAHGAGADQRHAFMVAAGEGLARRGVDVTTFNFPYTEKKRRAPDRPDVLEACFRAVIAAVSSRRTATGGRLFIGGKSMGGRMASHVAAAGERGLFGLVLLGYPLHPPGQPEKLRDKHLAQIEIPILCVQGSRDAFGTPEELAPIFAKLVAKSTMHVIDQGDHSFKVPKKVGSQARIFDEIFDVIAGWMRD